MKKTLQHNLTKTKETDKKFVLYFGNKFNHLIIFNKSIGHYKIIRLLTNHFQLNDNNCKVGWLSGNYRQVYNRQMIKDRLSIAKNY